MIVQTRGDFPISLVSTRFRLRMLLISGLVLAACANAGLYCLIPYAAPAAEFAADFVVEVVGRAVYRDAGCNLMLD